MSLAVAFLEAGAPPGYGARLQRLRWRRLAGAASASSWSPEDPAGRALEGAAVWLVVLDPVALPVPSAEPPSAVPGRVVVAAEASPEEPPHVHTLRELEHARLARRPAAEPAALLLRVADFPPAPGETVAAWIERLRGRGEAAVADARLAAVPFPAPAGAERPELTSRLPDGPLAILDLGCGAGGAIASAAARRPGWRVTGIEADSELARRARGRCARVLEGDLRRVLPELERAGERFDALVFADVLEHLEDPVPALEAARRVAAPEARLLVSVPNACHLSLVRDLAAGRFDLLPAGLTDAGHLRWFTRSFLAETIAEAGWRVVSIESEHGAPPPDAGGFLAATEGWPGRDLESLATYQWIATAAAGP